MILKMIKLVRSLLLLTPVFGLSLLTTTSQCQDSLFPRKIRIDSSGYVTDWPWNVHTNTNVFIVDLPWHLKYNNDHYVTGLNECKVQQAKNFKLISDFITTDQDQTDIIHKQDSTIAHFDGLDFKREAQHTTDSIQIHKLESRNTWTGIGGGLGWIALIVFVVLRR